MKITIRANERINNVKIIPCQENDPTTDIYAIEIDFTPSYLWSDLEMWLEDDSEHVKDHIAMNVSKRMKLITHK